MKPKSHRVVIPWEVLSPQGSFVESDTCSVAGMISQPSCFLYRHLVIPFVAHMKTSGYLLCSLPASCENKECRNKDKQETERERERKKNKQTGGVFLGHQLDGFPFWFSCKPPPNWNPPKKTLVDRGRQRVGLDWMQPSSIPRHARPAPCWKGCFSLRFVSKIAFNQFWSFNRDIHLEDIWACKIGQL